MDVIPVGSRHMILNRRGAAITGEGGTPGTTAILVDNAGAVLERLSYDPWGRRRCATPGGTYGSDYSCDSPSASQTDRGYTGHDMLDLVDMIDMKARVQSPVLGRFLSADDRVPGVFNSQAMNRYSYVNNNPLTFVDPMGHAARTNDTVIGWIDTEVVAVTANRMPETQFRPDLTSYEQTLRDYGALTFDEFGNGYDKNGNEVVVDTASRPRGPGQPNSFRVASLILSSWQDMGAEVCSALPENASIYAAVVAQGQVGSLAGPFAFGAALDSQGQAVLFDTVPYGPGVGIPSGGGAFLGVGVGGFNGVASDIRGPFGAVSGTVSQGRGVAGDVFAGSSGDRAIFGGGASIGVGQGATFYAGSTYTGTTPAFPIPNIPGSPLSTISAALQGYNAIRSATCGH